MSAIPHMDLDNQKIEKFYSALIAPCGMNCGICRAHLRPKDPCAGCGSVTSDCAKSLVVCYMRTCAERNSEFCFDCDRFPCPKLKQMDKRYRVKYGMSEIENLEYIREMGVDEFLEHERQRWISPKGVFCVHDKKYY